MSASTKLVEKLEGIDNFRAWKYRIGLILAENDLSKFIKEEVDYWIVDVPDEHDHSVQTDYWIVDVPDEHQTRHLFCSEHLESVSGGAQTCSFSGCKTCDEVP
jgi:hypothetical protein